MINIFIFSYSIHYSTGEAQWEAPQLPAGGAKGKTAQELGWTKVRFSFSLFFFCRARVIAINVYLFI